MFPLLLSSAFAAPSPVEGAEAFRQMAVQAHGRHDPIVLASPGSRKLDVYRYGDLAVMHDADGEWFAEALERGADLNWVLGSIEGAFYDHFEDDYQYLTIFMVRDLGFFVAFYSPLANDVYGIGYDSTVAAEAFDFSTDTQLDGMIFMNWYGLWYDDPELGRYVFGQEFGHRWGAFANVAKEGVAEDALLGRDTAHWSYLLDTTNSPMEGNDWLDNGDGTWSTQSRGESTYSDLDLYLMGFIGPDEVGEQTLLQAEDGVLDELGLEAGSTPAYMSKLYTGSVSDTTLAATPITFTVDDIIAAEGERIPTAEDSPRSFRMAFLVLVLSEDVADETVMDQIDGVRQTFEADWETDVGGRADLDTTLGDGDAPTWLDEGDSGDSGGDSAPIDCCKGDPEPEGCGCESGGAAPALGLVLAALVGARRRTR